MKREVLTNGRIRLTALTGAIVDRRNGREYAIVVCSPEKESNFAHAEYQSAE